MSGPVNGTDRQGLDQFTSEILNVIATSFDIPIDRLTEFVPPVKTESLSRRLQLKDFEKGDASMNRSPAKETYLDDEDVCRRWCGKITSRTLRRWRAAGEGPAWAVRGKRVVYPLSSLIDWEEKQIVYTKDQPKGKR